MHMELSPGLIYQATLKYSLWASCHSVYGARHCLLIREVHNLNRLSFHEFVLHESESGLVYLSRDMDEVP